MSRLTLIAIILLAIVHNADADNNNIVYLLGMSASSLRTVTVEEVEQGINYQFDSLAKKTGDIFKIKIYPNSEELMQAIRAGKTIGYIGNPALALKEPSYFEQNSFYSPVDTKGQTKQRYVLLVRKDGGINQFSDLKNTSLSYCQSDDIGSLYLQKLVKNINNKNSNLTSFFKQVAVKTNPYTAISSVFFKENQSALVFENDFIVAAELNPQLKEQLKILETSPMYINYIMAITNNYEGNFSYHRIENQILSVSESIKKYKFLSKINYTGMRKIKLEDMSNVRDLINDLNKNTVP